MSQAPPADVEEWAGLGCPPGRGNLAAEAMEKHSTGSNGLYTASGVINMESPQKIGVLMGTSFTHGGFSIATFECHVWVPKDTEASYHMGWTAPWSVKHAIF